MTGDRTRSKEKPPYRATYRSLRRPSMRPRSRAGAVGASGWSCEPEAVGAFGRGRNARKARTPSTSSPPPTGPARWSPALTETRVAANAERTHRRTQWNTSNAGAKQSRFRCPAPLCIAAVGHDQPCQRHRCADSREHERGAGGPRGKKPEFRRMRVSSCATPGASMHMQSGADVGSTSTLRVIAMREKQSREAPSSSPGPPRGGWFTPEPAVHRCLRGCWSCACYSGVRG